MYRVFKQTMEYINKINHKKYLYNINKDPFERNNLCTTNKDMADYLTHKLDNLQTQPTQSSGIMTENEISMVKESLKGLGYLDD